MAGLSLYYNEEIAPSENIRNFYGKMKVQCYEWRPITIQKKKKFQLICDWSNWKELHDLCLDFQNRLLDHLLDYRGEESSIAGTTTQFHKCIRLVRDINSCLIDYQMTYQVIDYSKHKVGALIQKQDLPSSAQQEMERVYRILQIFFQNMGDAIKSELKEFQARKLVRQKSPYKWNVSAKNPKRFFSELCLALMQSKIITREDGKQFSEAAFARDLGAFFDIGEYHFRQDIAEIEGSATRNRTAFLEKLIQVTKEYYRKVDEK